MCEPISGIGLQTVDSFISQIKPLGERKTEGWPTYRTQYTAVTWTYTVKQFSGVFGK